jgi:hypothetical protein
MSLTYEDALARLFNVHESVPEHQATALCPAHPDHDASLSVGKGDDGKLLLTCHRGCTFEQIVATLNGTAPDPASSNGTGGHRTRKKRPKVKRQNVVDRSFNYLQVGGDGAGTIVAVHRRVDYDDDEGKHRKDLWWQRAEHGRRGLAGLRLEELPLYMFPTLRARSYGSLVYLVEGELKCDRLNAALRAAGVDALCVATGTGAESIPCDATLEALLDYDVVLWADNDDPGRKHMQRIAAWLQARGESPRWAHWPDAPVKGDVADFLAMGHTVADVVSLIGEVPGSDDLTSDKEAQGEETSRSTHQDEKSSEGHADNPLKRGPQGQFPLLSVVQLGKLGALKPEELVPRKIMKRSLVLTYGDGETGKSYYVQGVCFDLSAAGVPVWYVAAEGFDDIYLRILAWLAIHPDKNLDALRVIPFPVQIFKGNDASILAGQARALPEEQRPAVVVLDTIHRCVVGARESDNSDMGCVANTAALWRTEFGATTWGIHHEGKHAGQGMRGASCLYDDADTVQYVFRGGDISVIECEKQKGGIERFKPEAFTVDKHPLDEWGQPGLHAGVVKSLPSDQIIEARRMWAADQQRRQPGAKNAPGGEDGKKLPEALQKGLDVFNGLLAQHPEGVLKSTWREAAVKSGAVAEGSFGWTVRELEKRGKVVIRDTTGRYLPGESPSG